MRFPDGIPPEVQKQADFEVGVITAMNFPGYFLVVADFINWAKDNGIRVGPGRGSGAGSMVAYAMRITDLNPLQHGLIFERFLNPDRVSMPDFDVDFDERRRGDVIRYVTEKYGDDRVAQIVTYGTIKAKQAVKDSARVLGMPFSVGDRITKVMPPPVMGKDMSLAKMFEPSDPRYSEAGEFRTLAETDPDVKRVVEMAKGLEGLKRQWGVHAAGVIMSSDPLLDLIPIMKREQDGAIITQFDYPTCESLGLIKMDFLGLRNLTILDDAVANVRANRGEAVVLEDLPLDDGKAYELLARGDTLGVFQLDGGPMRALLRSMKPDNFEDISAVIALYRPGPMGANAHNDYADRKNNRKPVVPIHPELAEPLAEILGDTYGLIVYQEQVMAIAQHVAGYSLGPGRPAAPRDGQEEEVRAGQAVRELLQGHGRARLLAGRGEDAVGHPAAVLRLRLQQGALRGLRDAVLLDRLPEGELPGRVHGGAADLASVTTRTRWRSTWPNAGPWGSRCCRRTSTPRCGTSRRSAPTSGSGCPPSATSAPGWSPRSSPCRKDKGDYTDFYDFLEKVDQVACNKKVVESLIKAGAFDSLNHPRKGLLMEHARAIDEVLGLKKAEAIGQFDLFGEMSQEEKGDSFRGSVPDTEWDTKLRLGFEREMLGLYVSGHPLSGVEHILSAQSDASVPGHPGRHRARPRRW